MSSFTCTWTPSQWDLGLFECMTNNARTSWITITQYTLWHMQTINVCLQEALTISSRTIYLFNRKDKLSHTHTLVSLFRLIHLRGTWPTLKFNCMFCDQVDLLSLPPCVCEPAGHWARTHGRRTTSWVSEIVFPSGYASAGEQRWERYASVGLLQQPLQHCRQWSF